MGNLDRREFIKKISAFSGLLLGAPTLIEGLGNKSSQNKIYQENLRSIEKRLSAVGAKHPSLHFDAKRLKQLRKQAKGTHQRYAEKLYQWVDENKSWSPPKVTGAQGDEVPLEESAAFLTNASLAFCLSKKKKHFEIARKWAVDMADYPQSALQNYGIGIYSAGLARAYDWLYHDLSAKDRRTIQMSLSNIINRMYKRAQPGAENQVWWATQYLHHDFWTPNGGYGEAALALTGEVDNAHKLAAFAKANFYRIFLWLGNDGAWHEGAADWCYAMAPLLWFYGAWETVTGEDLHNQPWIQHTAAYRLYHWLPNNHYVNLSDSVRSGRYSTSGGASCHLLRRFASLFQDGYAQWLAGKDEKFDFRPSPKGVYKAPYEGLSYKPDYHEYMHPQSQTMAWNMLWYDPTVKPVSPSELSAARHFENMGIVIMRTGWSNDDAVISFSCAPHAGHVTADRLRRGKTMNPKSFYHDHIDYNSFTLFANGQYFIIPPGYAWRASGFQNVVSINGADFNTDPSLQLQIAGFINKKIFSYAVGDATRGFYPQLGVERYRRHILLFENRWLIIFDNIRLNKEGQENYRFNRFNWTVHNDPNTHTLSIDGSQVKWKSKKSNKTPLSLHIMEPLEFGWNHELFQSQKGKPMVEALRLRKPEFYDDKKRVLSVWSWDDQMKTPKRMEHPKFHIVLLENDKAVGFAGAPASVSSADFSNKALKGRELYLFGTNLKKADSFLKINNGRIQ